MLNTRFFDEMDDFRRSFEQLFDSVSRPVQKGGRNSSEWYFAPPVETGWTDDHLNLRFVVPAVADNDIEITVQGNQLKVSGQRRAPQDFGKDGATYRALPYGKFERVIDLPNGLNTDKLQASLHDGVLDVRIAVAEAMKPRKIEIAAEPTHKVIAA